MSKIQNRKKNVLIIQWLIKHYRKPFYEQLRNDLSEFGFNLTIAYSQPPAFEDAKQDNIELDPEYSNKVTSYWFFGNRLLFQNALRDIFKADYIIIEHANKHILNYFLLLLGLLRVKKIAFWGHGRNFQSDGSNFSDTILKFTAALSSWWFAYTEASSDHIQSLGYPTEKITVVENSIDALGLMEIIENLDAKTKCEYLENISASANDPIGLFCGSFYEHKKLPFIFDSIIEIKNQIPNFKFLFIGNGPDMSKVEEFCKKNDDFAFNLGFLDQKSKAPWFSISDLMINPGLVGLSIIDSFAAGLPIITANISIHSPEIAYLQSNYNGLILENDVEVYSKEVILLLKEGSRLKTLAKNAKDSGKRLTIENMSKNFSQGICDWTKAR